MEMDEFAIWLRPIVRVTVIRKMGMYRILKTQDGSEIPKKKSQQNKNKAKPNTRSNVRILENMPLISC